MVLSLGSANRALDSVQLSWLRWAEKAIEDNLASYEMFEDYYVGDHELQFQTQRWEDSFGTTFEEFADNWCSVVVDAVAQRMRVLGWDSDDKGVADAAQEIWDDPENPMHVETADLHTQTLVKGDGFLISWPDPLAPTADVDTGVSPRTYYNDATEVVVAYDPQNRRRINRGVKKWIDEAGQVHLRFYYPDRTEQYIIPRAHDPENIAWYMTFGAPVDLNLPEGWYKEGPDIPNEFNEVPVFHFKNRALGSTHGLSELKQVIPIQNAVNKMLMDMMLTSEFTGFPQKHFAGGGIPKDGWRAGPERVWATTDPQAKFGQFDPGPLDQYVRVTEMLVGHIAKITQTPMHYLRASGDMPSGEALKTAESGLVHKCRARSEEWNPPYSAWMTFAILQKTGTKPSKPPIPVWDSFETRHDLEQAQTAQLKALLGVPLSNLLVEHFGYTEKQVKEFASANKLIITQTLQQLLAQTGQLPPGLEDVGSLNIPQLMAALPKAVTGSTAAGEATTNPQANTRPPASPTRRSSGFQD